MNAEAASLPTHRLQRVRSYHRTFLSGRVRKSMTSPTRPRELLFCLSAVAAIAAALFHAAAMASPAIARIEYEPTYPAWRHVVFIAIDGSLAPLLLRRPRWLVWAYGLLTLQILNSHGLGAWRLWQENGQIDWISVAVSLAAPAILALLIVDRRARRERTAK